MVDTKALAAAKAKVAVVPPRIVFRRLRKQPNCVMQAQGDQCAQVVALFFSAVNAVLEANWIPDIGVIEGDVEVSHEHQARMQQKFGAHPVTQALKPTHFVFKFIAAGLVSVGEIAANHPHPAQVGADHARHVI